MFGDMFDIRKLRVLVCLCAWTWRRECSGGDLRWMNMVMDEDCLVLSTLLLWTKVED